MKKLFSAILLSLIVLVPVFAQPQFSWQNIGPGGGSDLHFIAIQPDNPDVIYVGGDIEGIFKSTNGGVSWQNINNNLAHLPYGGDVYWTNDIVIDPVNYQRIYFCSGAGLFRSEDGGQNWNLLYPQQYNPEDPLISVSTVGIDSTNTNRIFMGLGDGAEGSFADFEPFPDYDGEQGLYRSLDGGNTWQLLNTGMPAGTSIHSIVVLPQSPDTIIVSTSKGIYRSVDGGNTWQPANNGLPHTNIHRLQAVRVDSLYYLFASLKTLGTPGDSTTFQGGIFRSSDIGQNWIDITADLPHYDPEDSLFYDYWKFDVNPTDPDMIVTATTRGSGFDAPGVYATWDGGLAWDQIYMPVIGGWLDTTWFWDPYAFDIKMAPSNPNRMVLCLVDVEMSDDGGINWYPAFTQPNGNAWTGNGLELMNTEIVAFHPSNPDIFWVGYDDMGLFRSDDGGNSFVRLDPHMDPTIGSLTGIDAVKDIQVDPANGDLYLSRYQGSQGGLLEDYSAGGVVFSNDLGNTQTDISNGLPAGRCDLVLDVQSGSPGNRTLYTAIFHQGVYKSANSGASWTAINTGLGNNAQYAWEIAIHPDDPQVLYLGLNSRGAGIQGLYKTTDGGQSWQQVSNFPAGDVLSIYVDSGNRVYASVTDNFDWNTSGGLYVSEDGGTTWQMILNHSRIVDFTLQPGNPQVLLATAQPWYKVGNDLGSIYLSVDGGQSWQDISDEVDHTFFNFARFHPQKPNEIYAGTAGGGLWFTNNAPVGIQAGSTIPGEFKLLQNYPNPFNPVTNVEFGLQNTQWVTLKVYDLIGREVKTLVNERKAAGIYTVQWGGTNDAGQSVASGVYLYRLTVGQSSSLSPPRVQTRKMVLLR